jgi:N6-L-threonylcarbamoyladenine synthase
MLVLGIETSCDETAAAVVADGRHILGSVVATQFELHAVYGGVVPELAARRHLENIAPVIQGALDQAGVGLGDLDGLAATQRPGLIGALVVGMAVAKALAYSLKIPLAGVHHLESHIAALWLTEAPPPLPLVALVVSGGHTNLYRVDSLRIHDPAVPHPGRRRGGGLRQGGQAHGPGLSRRGGHRSPGPGRRCLGLCSAPAPHPGRAPDLQFTAASRPRWPTGSKKTRPSSRSRPRADLAASFQEAVVDSLVTRAWAGA